MADRVSRRGPANGVSHIINFAPAPGGAGAGAGRGRGNCYNYHATDTCTDFMRRGHATTQHSPPQPAPAPRAGNLLFFLSETFFELCVRSDGFMYETPFNMMLQ